MMMQRSRSCCKARRTDNDSNDSLMMSVVPVLSYYYSLNPENVFKLPQLPNETLDLLPRNGIQDLNNRTNLFGRSSSPATFGRDSKAIKHL